MCHPVLSMLSLTQSPAGWQVELCQAKLVISLVKRQSRGCFVWSLRRLNFQPQIITNGKAYLFVMPTSYLRDQFIKPPAPSQRHFWMLLYTSVLRGQFIQLSYHLQRDREIRRDVKCRRIAPIYLRMIAITPKRNPRDDIEAVPSTRESLTCS